MNVTHLTTAMVSNAGSNFVAASGGITGTNITGTVYSNGLSLSVAAPGAGAAIQGSGTYTQNSGTIQFSNANGVTFGLTNGVMTASITPAGGAQTAISGLSAGTTQMTSGTAVFSNSNGISFGINGNTVTASYNSTQFQLTGNYLTTAMASNAGSNFMGLNSALTANGVSMTANSSGLSLNFPAFLTTAGLSQNSSLYAATGFTTTSIAGAVVAGTHDTNGLKLAVPAYLTTAQAPGAYLTTARASNDAIGLNTAGTNVTWTVNSSGISLNAGAYLTTAQPVGAYLTTAMLSNAVTISNINLSAGTTSGNGSAFTFGNANGVSFGYNAGTLTASVAAAGGAQTGISGMSAGTTLATSGTISFANSNGVSFGMNGNTMTATVATNYQSAGAYLTTARASNDAIGLNTALTGNGVAWTVNSSGLSLNVPAFLTTAMGSANSSLFAATGFTTTSIAGAVVAGTHDTNGLKLAVPAYLTTAQAPGAYLTTARASNDAIGLNTAQSNVTWTANSSGLSLDARGYAGTATTFAGTNVSGSMTFNSNGLNLALSAGAGGGVTPAISGSNGSFSFSTLSFGNLNGLSFYTSNGSIVGSYTDAGAGAGISAVVMSAGTTNSALSNFSFENSNGVSFGLNGSTITGSVPLNATLSYMDLVPFGIGPLANINVNSHVSIRYMPILQDVSFTRLDSPVNISLASTTTANTANIVITSGAVIYTRNGSTLNPIVGALGSTTYTWASNTANYSSVIGGRYASFPIATQLTPGDYWVGIRISTTNNSSIGTAITVLANSFSMIYNSYISAQNWAEFGQVTSVSSFGLVPFQGVCSVNLTATSQTYQLSQVTLSGSGGQRANIYFRLRNY